MTDNEQRAHDIALAFLQHDLNSMSGKDVNDERFTISQNADNKASGRNIRTTSVLDQYQDLYKQITSLLDG